jgi:16S rRNA (adenine1518-N6/adenine1519-N6)-dimethyltransferase
MKNNAIKPIKQFGQHFLNDKNLLKKIVSMPGDISKGTTIEIGPGMGSLTREILNANANIIAIEKDQRMRDSLHRLSDLWPKKLTLIFADALKIDIHKIGTKPRRVIANLPYNIGTEILVRCLEKPNHFSSLTMMLQKEVAERIVAEPGSKSYGRLSILVGSNWKSKLALRVNAKSFIPPPKVDSAVIHLQPYTKPISKVNLKTLSKLTKVSFSNRRKMLRSSLKELGNPHEICSLTGIDSSKRPQDLTIQEFCSIAQVLDNK